MTERTLPNPVEAEMAFIGSILLLGTDDDANLAEILPLVPHANFHDDRLATIKRAADHLHRLGIPIDTLTIVDRLRTADQYDAIGGAAFMASAGLQVPTSAHVRHYAEIINDAAEARWAYQTLIDNANAIITARKLAGEVISDLQAEIQDHQRESQSEAVTTEDQFNRWARGIIEREPQQLFECGPYGSEISKFTFGPETVTMIGAPPAAGKTAFCGQVVFDALRYSGQENIKLLSANVEMPPSALLSRQAARTSGISYSYLYHRDYDESVRPRIEAAIDELHSLMPRVEFMRPPFTLENLRRRVEAFDAEIVLVDYAQRFSSEGKQTDLRLQTNAVMDCCRMLADQGRAVIVVSALSRQKSTGGASYDHRSMGLASFRESSELEYGSDCAWLLLRDPDSEHVELKCVKNRTGKLCSLQLLFDGSHQSFRDDPKSTEWDP